MKVKISSNFSVAGALFICEQRYRATPWQLCPRDKVRHQSFDRKIIMRSWQAGIFGQRFLKQKSLKDFLVPLMGLILALLLPLSFANAHSKSNLHEEQLQAYESSSFSDFRKQMMEKSSREGWVLMDKKHGRPMYRRPHINTGGTLKSGSLIGPVHI